MKKAAKSVASSVERDSKRTLVQSKLVPDTPPQSTYTHEPKTPVPFASPLMRISHWNVNSINACHTKDSFKDYYTKNDFDIICFNETKLSWEKFVKLEFAKNDFWFNKYYQYWHFSTRKLGYSGVAVFAKEKPLSVAYKIGLKDFDEEGRCIVAEFPLFYLVYVYVPNAGEDLTRLEPRTKEWDVGLRKYMEGLREKKGVILLGDLNVAPEEIDLTNPKNNKKSPGFTEEERAEFKALKDAGFKDCFRELYPKEVKYTWWNQRAKTARLNNIGWRIDHCVVDERMFPRIKDVILRNDIHGSDHCPVEVLVNIENKD